MEPADADPRQHTRVCLCCGRGRLRDRGDIVLMGDHEIEIFYPIE